MPQAVFVPAGLAEAPRRCRLTMTLVASLRNRQLEPAIRKVGEEYSVYTPREERLAWQLRAWNAEWSRIRSSVPYYMKRPDLPTQFESWEQFLEFVPPTTRGGVRHNLREMTDASRPPEFFRITGGSTAQPVQLPAWKKEFRTTTPDLWWARSWYSISPKSRLFLLWGHSHLLGQGFKGWLNARKRELYDSMLGYYRFSAYDLQAGAMREAARAMITFHPEYIIGYSVALDLFARAAQEYRAELRGLGVKAVIGAAEAFPTKDSEKILNDLFGCPVAMEYASVETNLIAHAEPQGGYRVFWRTYFLEVDRSTRGARAVRLTSLYPRCFPLLRYELGDQIELCDGLSDEWFGIEVFKRVAGRCNDYVKLRDGSLIHSEAFTHAVRGNSAIEGYQVVQNGEDFRIRVLVREGVNGKAEEAIRSQLAKIHPELARSPIERVAALEQTVAGKVPMIVRKT